MWYKWNSKTYLRHICDINNDIGEELPYNSFAHVSKNIYSDNIPHTGIFGMEWSYIGSKIEYDGC